MEKGSFSEGSDAGVGLAGYTLAECQDLCRTVRHCVAVDYDIGIDTHPCWLHFDGSGDRKLKPPTKMKKASDAFLLKLIWTTQYVRECEYHTRVDTALSSK